MSNISITEEGKFYAKSKYFSGSQILNHDYQDKLTNIVINSHCSLNGGERMNLANNIDQVRKIFSGHTDNNIKSVWIDIFDITNLDTDKFKKREIEGGQEKYWKNSIHVRFGSVQDKVLVYSWLDIDQFNQDKWNNLLSQLDRNHKIDLIGTGPLTFKYKDFNYRVYPPLFVSSDDEKSFLNNPEVYNFSPTEVNKIIEDIKESHQSIEKKIANHYKSLGKDFAENNEGYIKIKADIDKTSSVKNFTDVSYISRDNKQIQIEEAFVKEEERNNVGNPLHLHFAVYTNSKSSMEQLLGMIDVNKVNKNDRTPLHLAAKYCKKDMVEMLLNKGAKVDVVDNRGRTPLHLAAQYNEKKEIVEMLLNQGAKVDIADNRGRTPLHLAAANGHKEVVEVLSKAEGINVNAVDEDGKTPFDLAKTEEIKTLLKKAAEKTDDSSVSTDSEGDQEKDAGQEGNVQPVTQEQDPKEEQQEISAEEESDVKIEAADNGHSIDITLTQNGVSPRSESSTNEEQPSSFFSSLFGILIKPFSLIGSFLGGFFSWLFGSDEPSTESDQIIAPSNSGGEELKNYQESDNNII